MKYLVVCSGDAGEEKTLCPDERDAIALVESKLTGGLAQADVEVYAAEPISFNVERVPVVTLGEETAEAAPYSGYTSDEKSETANPFSTEQVFSLDS